MTEEQWVLIKSALHHCFYHHFEGQPEVKAEFKRLILDPINNRSLQMDDKYLAL